MINGGRYYWERIAPFVTAEPEPADAIGKRAGISREAGRMGLRYASYQSLVRETFRRRPSDKAVTQSMFSTR
jgi:hypothetical protein